MFQHAWISFMRTCCIIMFISSIFLNLLLQPLDLLLMTNMSLFDQFIGITNHVIMNIEHSGGGNIMIKVVVVYLFNFFQCVHKSMGDVLVELICSIELRGSNILDLGERFENEFKLGVEVGNLLIDLGIKLSNSLIEGINLGNRSSNVVSEF